MFFAPHCAPAKTGCFSFGASVTAAAADCLRNETIRSFWHGFTFRTGELTTTPADGRVFTIGTAERPAVDGADYAINVEETGVCIAADTDAGLIRGFVTLLHRIRPVETADNAPRFELPCGMTRESACIARQMVHFCVFPETELWELEKFIRFCGALKYTHIVVEFWGMFRFACLRELSWPQAYTKEQLKPILREAHDLGMEIIPMFNHWGHASASRVMHGKHVVLDQNPSLWYLFTEDGWTWNIASPKVRALMRQIRAELMELCGEGRYFHLGCDEAYNVDVEKTGEVLIDYLNEIAGELAECGRRPIMWGDMLVYRRPDFNAENSYTAFCRSPELERKLLSALDKRIVIADWQYSVRVSPVETALVFRDAGFDVLLCPWDQRNSVTPCVETVRDAGLYGVLHTTWNTLSKGTPRVAQVAWEAWDPSGEKSDFNFIRTHAAAILRKAYDSNGIYERTGWAKQQISTITD